MIPFKHPSRPARTQPLRWLLLGCLLWLTACSGSDSSSQPLKFAQSGTAKLITGERYANPATGKDAASASYRSSNPNIATVDAQGSVLAKAAGTATITATTNSARGSYRVDVVNRTAQLEAWVGTTDSELTLSAGMEGTALFASSDMECDFDQTLVCDDLEIDLKIANGATISSQAVTLAKPGRFQLQQGNHRADAVIGLDRFLGVESHQAVYFKDQFWVIGGSDTSGSDNNDVYSSGDGLNWFKRTIQAEDGGEVFSARRRHSVVVFNDQLWLVAGKEFGDKKFSDVWSSKDGVTWKRVLADDDIATLKREDYQVVVFDAPNDGKGDRLWLVGGIPPDNSNNVWVTDNGEEWEPVPLSGDALPDNVEHQVVVFDAQDDSDGEKLWFIGGDPDATALFSSADGREWKKHSATSDGDKAFPGYGYHQVVAYQNKLWLIGGYIAGGATTSDVWSSTNGTDWHLETDQASFPERASHQVVVAEDRLWLIGGSEYNDVWSSTDGITWTLQSNEAEFSARENHQVVRFDDDAGEKLWLIGGNSGGAVSNDIWVSSDGLNWTKQNIESESDIFSPRHGHQVAVFENELWLVGGSGIQESGSEGVLNDVWSSMDGVTWVNRTVDTKATFDPRQYHQLVVYNDDGGGDALYLIGGSDGRGVNYNDVWKLPATNQSWEEFGDFATCISEHQAVVFNNELWVVGGLVDKSDECPGGDISNGRTNAVWSLQKSGDFTYKWEASKPTNGEAWFSARKQHQVVVFENELWVVGGSRPFEFLNDVWKSEDGKTWNKVADQADFPSRYGHQLIAFDDSLWVIGGYGGGFVGYLNDIWTSTDGEHWRRGIKTRFNFRD